MKKIAAEPVRDIDFSRARRGSVIGAQPGKVKISIRLDARVVDHFKGLVERQGGGNYQSLINDALVAYIQRSAMIDAVRQVLREELSAGPISRRVRA